MRINSENNTIQISFLLEKFSINFDMDIAFCEAINFFVDNTYDYNSTIDAIVFMLKIKEETAKKLFFSTCALFFDNMEIEKQNEIKSVFLYEKLDFEKYLEDIKEDFGAFFIEQTGEIISSKDSLDDTFKALEFHIKSMLLNPNNDIVSVLDDKMYGQLMFNPDLNKNLLISFTKNKDLIGSKAISKHLIDFSNDLGDSYESSALKKQQYLGGQKLNNIEKDLLSRVLEIYLRIKFFPESVKNVKVGDWFIIPCEKLQDVQAGQGVSFDKEDIIRLFKEDILKLFEYEDDINDYLIDLVSDSSTKQQIENAIYLNEKILFDKEFSINGRLDKSSIANWIKNYIAEVGIDKYNDLALSKFVIDSKNAKNLDQKDKDLLYKILKTYLNIKFFPEIFDDVPEDQWSIIPATKIIETKKAVNKVFVQPTPVKIPEPVIKKQNPAEALLVEYKSFEKSISNTKNDLLLFEKYKNNLDEFYGEFDEMIRSKDKQKLISAVAFIVKNKLINIFIKNNKNLFIEFKKSLLLKFDEDIVTSISNNLDSIETVSLYLQFLFTRFALTPRETGLYGMYIANIFKKSGQEKYFPIVYGDINLGQFLFRDVVEIAGKLKLK